MAKVNSINLDVVVPVKCKMKLDFYLNLSTLWLIQLSKPEKLQDYADNLEEKEQKSEPKVQENGGSSEVKDSTGWRLFLNFSSYQTTFL